jgi:hypothetical protein
VPPRREGDEGDALSSRREGDDMRPPGRKGDDARPPPFEGEGVLPPRPEGEGARLKPGDFWVDWRDDPDSSQTGPDVSAPRLMGKAPATPPRRATTSSAGCATDVGRQYSTHGGGATPADAVFLTKDILDMIERLEAELWISPSSGWCGFDSLAAMYNEIFGPDDAWTAGDVRAQIGQLYVKHVDSLLAFESKYRLLPQGRPRRVAEHELRRRGDMHKKSFVQTGTLSPAFWLNATDIKSFALEFGLNIFVVSTEETRVVAGESVEKVTVLKYLSTASPPGLISIDLEKMGMAGFARGEAVVGEDDIVLIYNGAHYNALSWDRADEDGEGHDEAHFNGDFADE